MNPQVNKEEIKKIVTEEVKKLISFTSRKLADTPTDDYQVTPRGYVNMNGTVANRPKSSVASVGQFYLATDTNQPMWYTAGGWRDGNASIVALNN